MPARIDVTIVLYAVLSLTIVRMVPVALDLLGARLDRNSVLFVGGFGPGGLASLVFALLALEEIGPGADQAVVLIGAAVFLSVAHGVTAGPLATRYGRAADVRGPELGGAVPDVPGPRLPRRRDAAEPKAADKREP